MAYTEPTDTKLLFAKLELAFPSFEYKECKHIKYGYDHDILMIAHLLGTDLLQELRMTVF